MAMLLKRFFFSYLLCLLSLTALSQAIDNTLSFKNINSTQYSRLNYENDVFSATDIYYTQGICLELAFPAVGRSVIHRVLIDPHFYDTRYTVAVQHNGYTPTSISSDTLLRGDRPFTACLFAQASLLAIDIAGHQRF